MRLFKEKVMVYLCLGFISCYACLVNKSVCTFANEIICTE